MAAGIVEMTRSQARRRSGSRRNERSRIVARPAGISRSQSSRKYSSKAASVPAWSATREPEARDERVVPVQQIRHEDEVAG